jgi:Xaa-Pro dipeptidase
MYRACKDALLACEAAIQPGRPMGDVYQAHAEVLDAAGFGEHRMRACGYGMSAIYNPLWVDPPMFYEGNSQLMEEGNTFFLHMILANSHTGRAMTLGHTVLITKSGCERLSRSSLDLVVK